MEKRKTSEAIEPKFVTINDAARYTGESAWTIKNELRKGRLKAKKAGRRTLVEFATVKARAENLPDATFTPCQQERTRS